MPGDDTELGPWTAVYSSAEITPTEFEQFVAEVLAVGEPGLENFAVTCHEKIEGVDGTFDFDATVRYRYLGMDFLVIVEAKFHNNPIKRELVQVLHSKKMSVGAHKALMISMAQFQTGAIEVAKVHGIALVSVTEGRFTFETRASTPTSTISREEAAELYELPTFVGVHSGPGNQATSTIITIVRPDDPERVQQLLLGVPAKGQPDTAN
jgi:hypothetical protein